MQTIERLLRVTGSVGEWTNELGKPDSTPEIAVGVCAKIRLDLRSPEGDENTHILLPLPEADVSSLSYYLALDSDYLQETPPRLLSTENIQIIADEQHTYLEAVLPNTARQELLDALTNNESVSLNAEIGGYSGGNDPTAADFVIQFPLLLRNRVYLGTGDVPPEVEEDPRYLTAEQVKALIAEATRPPKGDKGDPGASAYEIAVAGGYEGTEAEWLASLKGEPGASAYKIAVAGGYNGTEAEWLASLIGATGLSAYELAVLNGFIGTVDDWLESLRGADGHDLHFDATGELSELSAYAGEAAGFTFAASTTDAQTKTTKLYIYAKRSGDFNDWCNPLVLTYYERSTEITALAPVTMTAPPDGAEYFSFDAGDYPNSTVAAVTIDTDEGELTLPYYSALGVRKIVRKNGKFLVYLGSQCPEFATGKIYLTQFLVAAAQAETPGYTGKMYYGYIPQEVLGTTYRIGQITAAMLEDSRSVITEADTGTLGKTSLGTVPAGALVVVLLPTGNGLVAEKFDGLGGYVEFIENNVESGTGANGAGYSLDGEPYSISGEYVLAAAEISIRITEE